MIESLAGILTGAALTRQVLSWVVGDPTRPTGHGAAFVAVNVAAMMPVDEFKRRADGICRRSGSARRGLGRVYLPGEIEWERRRRLSRRDRPARRRLDEPRGTRPRLGGAEEVGRVPKLNLNPPGSSSRC